MIISQMKDADYRKAEGLAQSDLAYMKKSPGHFFNREKLRKETDAMRFGTIFHMALLEPLKFRELYLAEPEVIVIDGKSAEVNRRVKAHREYLENWKLDHADKVVLSAKQVDNLTGMLTEIGQNPILKDLITEGVPEIASFWEYRGRKCKGKADLFLESSKHGRVVIDFKKTQDASHSAFSRSVFNYNYDLQAAWYQRGFKADKVLFVPVEENYPHAFGIYDADPWLERGGKLADRLLDRLEECEASKVWPWYTSGIELIMPPAWLPGVDQDEDLKNVG